MQGNYKKALEGYIDQFKTAFEVALPGLLGEIKVCCDCMQLLIATHRHWN